MKVTKNINVHNGKTKNLTPYDIFDDHIKAAFNLTDEEYDFIADNGTDEEWDILLIEKPTFAQKRQVLAIRTKYLDQMKQA